MGLAPLIYGKVWLQQKLKRSFTPLMQTEVICQQGPAFDLEMTFDLEIGGSPGQNTSLNKTEHFCFITQNPDTSFYEPITW